MSDLSKDEILEFMRKSNTGVVRSSFDSKNVSEHNESFLEEWSKKHINYFEVIVDPEGRLLEFKGSHMNSLVLIATEMFSISEQTFYDAVPLRYHFNMMEYLNLVTDYLPVWHEFYLGNPSSHQIEALKLAKNKGIYIGTLPS